VPIKKEQQVVGAVSVDLPYHPAFDLKASQRLLTVVATMLAQHVINLETLQFEKEALREENLRLQQQLASKHSITNLVGNSGKMREVFQMIAQVCGSNATVLIRGESGTGKELVANAIHYNSPRAKQPFIKVNCAALPPTLIESELFGHEKGAFTGAIRQKRGKFELANKGTLFLDEIGAIGMDVQANLLRVLQEREFERVGGAQTIKTDVRIVVATNKNLEQAVEEGTFRGDLYYRLNVFPLYLPPLRERKTDILLLADHFLEGYAKENRKDIRRFSTPAIDMLMQYHWPGNVRELESRPPLRRRGDPKLPPSADLTDRREVRHLAGPLSGASRRHPETRDDHRRLEKYPGQYGQGCQPASAHGAQVRLQRKETRGRISYLPVGMRFPP
jgi:Nif-specific regulatory protein